MKMLVLGHMLSLLKALKLENAMLFLILNTRSKSYIYAIVFKSKNCNAKRKALL